MRLPIAGLLDARPAARSCCTGFQKDFLPERDEGSILYMPTTLPGLPNREAGWVVQQMDKKLKAIPGGGERLRQDRPRRHVDRSGAADDDRNDDPAEAEVAVAARDDEGQARRRDGSRDADRRLRQRLGAADPRARHDADHRHPDAGRHQGQGSRMSPHRGNLAADRGPAARASGHEVRDRRAHLGGLLHRRPERSRAHGRSTASPSTRRC